MKIDIKPIINLIRRAVSQYDERQVFSDFLTLSACKISNRVDPVHLETRALEYQKTWGKYSPTQQQLFDEMMVTLSSMVLRNNERGNVEDILGRIMMELNVANTRMGQNFTPDDVARVIAQLTGATKKSEKPYITISEPACGSGTMILATAEELYKAGRNFCFEMMASAVDIDIRCVQMTYIQLSLYGIPAVVIHGNSLTLQEYSRWYTPMYVLNNWVFVQGAGFTDGKSRDDELLKCYCDPMYAAIRQISILEAENTQKNIDTLT